jgi:uncharacterized protein YfeS
LGTRDIEHLDTFEKDGELFIKYTENRNTTLKVAIIQNKIKDIGKIKQKIKKLDLNADRKRQWFEEITDINERKMIDSVSISLSYFDKDSL